MNRQKVADHTKALRAVCDAIVDAVTLAGPQGVPGGTLYAALMGAGVQLETFQAIMAGIVNAGKLAKRGELYLAVQP